MIGAPLTAYAATRPVEKEANRSGLLATLWERSPFGFSPTTGQKVVPVAWQDFARDCAGFRLGRRVSLWTKQSSTKPMKQIIVLLATGFLLSCQPTFGQQASQQALQGVVPQPRAIPGLPGVLRPGDSTTDSNLTRFDLNFPGGTPKELVEAIEKAWLKPLNAIIPDELANMRLPAVKMNAVTVPQLFEALGAATAKTLTYNYQGRYGVPFQPGQQVTSTSYGFRTYGPPGDDAIWHFYYDRPNPPQEPKACRFYQLGSYLDNYKIEDITTAIETGWKMLGETERPEIKFHKDTKLLIAVGEPSKLVLIESVLAQLKQEKSMESKVRVIMPEGKSGLEGAKP